VAKSVILPGSNVLVRYRLEMGNEILYEFVVVIETFSNTPSDQLVTGRGGFAIYCHLKD